MSLNNTTARILATGVTIGLFSLIWLYTREYKVFMNTIGIKTLVFGAMGLGALAGGVLVFSLRKRFTPWDRHMPEVAMIVAFFVLFMPLFASLLNRAGRTTENQPFEFISEEQYLASGYGIIKGEKVKPSGYRLTVRKNGRILRFQYKQQAYYPLTKPGDSVLLPVKKGLLGFGVVDLK